MEVVLSPGRIGGGGNGTGSPFQNQEVREWSHVDRLTGMLEHARIETGRWQTRNQGTAQAYGKVIDSRERNSADGNVVQKARRQVEVFQSQGIGGRSVQVVRASQWSSSRITDSTSSSPVSVSMSDTSQLRNGNDESLQLAKLSQVSRLCRQINGDSAPTNINDNNNKRTNYRDKIGSRKLENGFREEISKIGLKSTSNEDLTKSVDRGAQNSQTIFTRDCKARRSLQIPKSGVDHFERNKTPDTRRVSPEGTEFEDRNGSFDRDGRKVKSYVLGMEEADSNAIASSLRTPKNMTDKKFPFNGFSVAANGVEENGTESGITKSEYLRPTPILLKPKSTTAILRNKSNKTVVHLNNKMFTEARRSSGSEDESISSLDNESIGIIRPINNTVLKSRVQSLADQFSQINHIHSSSSTINTTKINTTFISKKQAVVDSTGRIERSLSNNSVEILSSDDTQQQFSSKPVKKVGFCKTEVHFAAESGKVNIVETDCKPPPSNRFRRRRRSNPVTMNTVAGIQANKNLPLIHFGDTSYEKYIFGQSNGMIGKSGSESGATEVTDLSVKSESKDEVRQRLPVAGDEFVFRDGWGARIKTILQSEPLPISKDVNQNNDVVNGTVNFDGAAGVITEETIAVDHTFKGSHTTTVNLGADLISKLQKHTTEGKCNTISTGIQLQFKTRLQKVTPIYNCREITQRCKEVEDINPEKNSQITVIKNTAPCSIVVSTVSKIPRPLIQSQQSVLKSAHLVMNLNRINGLNSRAKGTVDGWDSSSNIEDKKPLTLKHLLSSLRDNKGDDKREETRSTLIKIDEKHSSQTSYRNRITNGKNYPALFTPLQLKHLNDKLNECEERRKIEDINDSNEHYQLQYSSGSEQADEEVRSYMLGSKNNDKTVEERSVGSDKTVKETRDNDDHDSIDKMVENHSIDDELDILNSGLPEEEICFESNGTVEKNHVSEKSSNDNNVVTSDNENNRVLFNVVTTHEPVIARVEETRVPEVRRDLFAGKKLRALNPRTRLEDGDKYRREKSAVSSITAVKKISVKEKAKDECDIKIGRDVVSGSKDDDKSRDPTYVNVFEGNGKSESVPIYENCCVNRNTKNIDDKCRRSNHVGKAMKSLAELNSVTDAIVKTTTNGNCESDSSSLSNTDCGEDRFKRSYSKGRDLDAKLSTISENRLIVSERKTDRESQKLKASKTRSKKMIVRSPSSTSSVESIHRNGSVNEIVEDSEKPLHAKSTRSSRLHRATNGHESSGKDTVDRYSSSDKKKAGTETKKSLNDSTRSKKPIEIVYQTAVFNMKNEKLVKSSRSKESKGPRYINDLICGSKPKRSTDVRHTKGSALPQQRVHHKSASPTHRHWK